MIRHAGMTAALLMAAPCVEAAPYLYVWAMQTRDPTREPGGNRLVITGFGSLSTSVIFATIDPRTGSLKLDPHRISFDRRWPDGWTGPAMPHGAVLGATESRARPTMASAARLTGSEPRR